MLSSSSTPHHHCHQLLQLLHTALSEHLGQDGRFLPTVAMAPPLIDKALHA